LLLLDHSLAGPFSESYKAAACDLFFCFTQQTAKSVQIAYIPLHLWGEYMVAPCYVYVENKWFWFESSEMRPWEDGWKRSPRPDAKGHVTHWLDKYPGRPTGP